MMEKMEKVRKETPPKKIPSFIITVVKEFTFDAAHHLPNHPGMCKNLHGHTYKLQVGFSGETLESGMVVDFSTVKQFIKKYIIDELDHKYLNDVRIPLFPADCSTAENMVGWMAVIIEWFMESLSEENKSICLTSVRLYETPTSYSEVRFRS